MKQQRFGTNWTVYLSGGPHRQHFTNPETKKTFSNQEEVKTFLTRYDPTLVFTKSIRQNVDYIVFPDEAGGASGSSLRYESPTLPLSAFIAKLLLSSSKTPRKTVHFAQPVVVEPSKEKEAGGDIIDLIQRFHHTLDLQQKTLDDMKHHIRNLEQNIATSAV